MPNETNSSVISSEETNRTSSLQGQSECTVGKELPATLTSVDVVHTEQSKTLTVLRRMTTNL